MCPAGIATDMTTTQTPSGKVALVTGANKGLGREIARQLGALGMTVLVGARSETRGQQTTKDMRTEGIDARFLQLDVTNNIVIDAAAKSIDEEFGRLDVLVNNAGIMIEGQRPISEVTVEEVRRTYETNVFGVVAVIHAMLPLLRQAPAARIVNMTSELGSLTWLADPNGPEVGPDLLAYCSSKAALNAVTVLYANELQDTGIKVNAVSPGYCATDLNNHSGFRTVEQGAVIAVQLATVDENGPTGAFLNEDGAIPW